LVTTNFHDDLCLLGQRGFGRVTNSLQQFQI
jgi:hypothetical protein